MKLLDINNNLIRADIDPKHFPIRGDSSRSIFQRDVGKKLVEKFPLYVILEEWTIPSSSFVIDFFIPQLGIVIEADGEQHRKFSKFFHGDINGFKRQKINDAKKNEWCSMNNFRMIRVSGTEEVDKI